MSDDKWHSVRVSSDTVALLEQVQDAGAGEPSFRSLVEQAIENEYADDLDN